ncbi:nucleoid-structuring protein H-NS [Mycobacterium malmoense]|uniref:Nucleoid-structuring protein H-NS n=1 Tax=Mycobacterium malmoense TaxID=1780 RepID=A0ABX3SKL2_MYCMA|nr:nucleoid-structuring protein H-NS [Mycobacterium malmoense]OIN81950.1 nucleoid-structuring protein H-NS [Mycobacterium malmoense]ORA77552.1 nucleoid-structuring protein H-NS [Mycobacterium malmoense]QZA17644.1 nucleoid-structuring protein H-NS [Mycobacterium malmoense]UNB94426.1 nucleoid-structuring protein H-NS [Mycobacterium malmoense]
MADPQEQPNSEPDGASAQPENRPENPPEKKPPAKAVKKTAKAPAKKAAAKKAPAKKAPAKKAPAKKVPAEKPAGQPLGVQQRIETNGELAAAAKDAAAQAKSTVDGANNPVSPGVVASASGQSPVPLIVALTLSLLAILLIRQLRRR